MSLYKILKPKEYQIQMAVIEWASYHPILKKYLIANQNEIKGGKEGDKRRKMGIRAGVSDLFLPYPCNGYYGLWLEIKSNDKKISKPTIAQIEWIERMKEVGYSAHIAWGYDESVNIINNYLEGDDD